MATIQTFTCRFSPRPMVGIHGRLTEYLVPVKWWSYDNDRLDGRGDAKLTEALVSVEAYSVVQARKLVVKEWGHYGSVGTATAVEAK